MENQYIFAGIRLDPFVGSLAPTYLALKSNWEVSDHLKLKGRGGGVKNDCYRGVLFYYASLKKVHVLSCQVFSF